MVELDEAVEVELEEDVDDVEKRLDRLLSMLEKIVVVVGVAEVVVGVVEVEVVVLDVDVDVQKGEVVGGAGGERELDGAPCASSECKKALPKL